MKRAAVTLAVAVGLGAVAASAKLPPPSDEAKAKAAETAAKNAWNDKVAGFKLCKAMDRVAATYAGEAKKAGKDVKPTATPACADPGPFAYSPPGAASAPPAAPADAKTPTPAQNPAAVKKS